MDGNPASTPVVADGLTVDQYTGIGAVPFAEVTINPQFGSPRTFAGTTVDTDTSVKGFQVTADAKGNFAFGVLRETGSGPATISVTDVTGQSGTGVVGPTGSGPLAATPNPYLLPNPFIQSYVLPAGRRIDFGPTGSPAASDSDPANPNYLAFGNAAYVSTVANALGWVGTAPQTLDRGAAFNNLQRDAVFGTPSTPGDFEFDLLPGTTYSVTAVLGDALNQENGMFIQVVDAATGLTIQSTPASGVNTPAGQSTSFTFPVTTDGLGRGRVRFGVSTSPSNAFWTLQDLEIRPTQGVLTISNPGPVLADGTTSTAYTITGATPNALITVTTSLGTITTADAGTTYTSLQVLANGAGVATFAITSPASTSNTTGTISASGVTGLKIGTLAQSYTGVVPPPPPTSPPAAVVARYDFNSGASPTSAGFTGVLPSTLYTASSGFGWKTAVNGYDRGNGTGGSPTTLFQDGAWGYGSGIFEVGVATGAARDVRLYYGDPYTGWTGISVKVEGNPTAALVDSVVDRYGFVTLSGSDANSDGILDITVLGGVWVASGLDIATTGGLPAPATPAASPLTAGVGRRLEFASPAIAGFTSVSNSATYTPGTGFGWEAAVNSFSRPASQFPAGSPLTPTQKQFYGNGAYNSGVSTFAIAVPLGAPGATYSIRAYVADPYTTWQGISLQGEGTAAQTVSSSVSPPASVTITGIADLNGDGIITLTMNGSPWVLNGLDVIDNTGVLPAAP